LHGLEADNKKGGSTVKMERRRRCGVHQLQQQARQLQQLIQQASQQINALSAQIQQLSLQQQQQQQQGGFAPAPQFTQGAPGSSLSQVTQIPRISAQSRPATASFASMPRPGSVSIQSVMQADRPLYQ
jgi:TolA-binding protein